MPKVLKFSHNKKNLLCIFQNNEDKGLYVKNGIIKEEQARFIKGSGVHLDDFCYTPEPTEGKIRVILTARMIVEKGVFILTEAAEKLRSKYEDMAEFLLVGGIDDHPGAITKEQLENYAKHYYIERIKPHFIKPVNEKLRSLQKDGYKVGLVSGGYGIYLRYFVEEFNLDFCISSNVEICNGSCTGRLDGLDCLNQNKICLLEKYFPSAPIESIAFSDSRSDLPLLLWVKRGVVISRDKHQNWIDNYKLEEIIWKKQNS